MIGDDAESVRQLGGRRGIGAGELVGDQRLRPDGDRGVVAGAVKRRGGRFDHHLQVRRIDGEISHERRISLQLIGDPATDGIVTPCEMPGVVRVQALDALARPADPTRWMRAARSDMLVALGRISHVRVGDRHGIDLRFGPPHTTGGLEAAHGLHLAPADQPVPRRHGRAVVEVWCVADDDRRARFVADHDLERAGRLAAEQLSDRRSIDLVGDHHPKYR